MKIVCPQCGSEAANEFKQTLAFCTDCGEKLSASGANESPLPNQFSTILLTSLVTSVIIFVLLGIGLYAYFSHNSAARTGSQDEEKSSGPTPRTKQKSLVPASDIERVSYTTWQHRGLLTSGTGSVVSENLSFLRDLTARKTSGVNYDNGDAQDRSIGFEGRIDSAGFERLAGIIVDSDFLNLPDSRERISEGDAFLIITYRGSEKKILTSNIGKDLPEVAEIIKTLKALDSAADWKEIKSKN
jgi:hypothetical protein